MDGVTRRRSSWLRKGEWLALRTIARCESPWIRFAAQFGTLVIMPGDDGVASGHVLPQDGLVMQDCQTSTGIANVAIFGGRSHASAIPRGVLCLQLHGGSKIPSGALQSDLVTRSPGRLKSFSSDATRFRQHVHAVACCGEFLWNFKRFLDPDRLHGGQ